MNTFHLFARPLLFVGLSLLLTVASFAANQAEEAEARGDAFDAQLKTKEALAAYLDAEKLGAKDAEIYRKIAREYALAIVDTGSKAEQKELGLKAVGYAQKAVATNPRDAQAHLALAICYGRVAPLLDNKTKIANSRLVKEHVEKSIALDPADDYAYHVLGAWHYELAGLNPLLRAVAQLVYGSIPPASYDIAVKNFKKAIELAPQRVSHHVELGRTYAALGQKDLARASINKGLALPNREKDDGDTKQRGRAALAKL